MPNQYGLLVLAQGLSGSYLLHTLDSLFDIDRGFSPRSAHPHTDPKRGDGLTRSPPTPPRQHDASEATDD